VRYRRLLAGLALAAAGSGLAVLYYLQSRAGPFNSDGAGNVLQAQAILHGNWLLRGWWSSDVSYYATELPEYVAVTAISGISPDVVHICGAVTYTLTVLLAAMAARAVSQARPAVTAPASPLGSPSRCPSPAAPGSTWRTRITRAPPYPSSPSCCSSTGPRAAPVTEARAAG